MDNYSLCGLKGHYVSNFWTNEEGENDAPFNLLGVNKTEYITKIVGYAPSHGIFPEVRHKSDLLQVLQQINRDFADAHSLIHTDDIHIGDKVLITRSSLNWASSMDSRIGQVVKVTSVSPRCEITFHGDGGWSYTFRDKHFLKLIPKEGAIMKGIKLGEVTPILINVCKI